MRLDQKYRILIVEDDLFDAELNIREVTKVLPSSKFKQVETKDDYIRTLKKFKPDIILSDYHMPSFDGLIALKIAREICPMTPFIVVTGSINEDAAVECMKSGASDYILKDSPKRLGSAVLSALEQHDLRIKKQLAETKLKESEESYLGLFNSVSEAIYIMDENGSYIALNNGILKMYGYSSDELIGQNHELLAATGLNDLTMVSNIIKTVYETGQSQQFDFWGKRKNGEIFPKEIIFNKGRYFGKDVIIATARDITERKEAEEKLLHEKKLLYTLIDNLPATIYVKDAKCRKTIANLTDLELIGAKSEDVIGKTDLEVFENEIGQRGYADDKMVIDTGVAVLNREEDFYDASGVQRWLLTSKIPLTNENEETIGLVGIGLDITEQKHAQEKILKLSKGIEQSPTSIEITDIDGIIEYVNPKLCETTGYSSEEIIGQHARILKSKKMPEEIYSDLWKTISSGNVWRKELINKKKDGSLFWESVTLTAIKNDKEIITNYIAIKEDITERKKMQAELILALEKAEESDQLKSAFLANMSHEIRTPLNSIIGFSELLGDPDFNEEERAEFIKTIVDNGNSLLVIISNIMDFSMLEAGQMKIRKEEISTKKLLNELLSDYGKKASQKGIELRLDDSLNKPDFMIENDYYRIKQIFNNLIGNALKFTHEGSIVIGYKIADKNIEFHVKDTGIGIAPEYQQAVFERFRQVDTAKTRKYGGNGLGLAISKNLVELLGGKIWLESEPNKYSDFFFTVPIKNI